MKEGIHALAALMFWAGIVLGLRGLLLAARLIFKPPGMDRHATAVGLGWSMGLGGAGILIGEGLFPPHGLGIPVAWPALAVQVWLSVFCAIVALVTFFQAVSGSRESRRWLVPVLWAAASAGCWLLPRANPKPVEFLTGHIFMSPSSLGAVATLAVAAVTAISLASRSARAKGIVATVATQLGLLVGCVVFGLPFLFLLVTSFKEDQDMSSPHGIVWIPRVKQTAPVLDPESPYYEAPYKGMTVQADLEKANPDGTLTLRIAHPLYFGGFTFNVPKAQAKQIPRDMELVTAKLDGQDVEGVIFQKLPDGSQDVEILKPVSMKGQRHTFAPKTTAFVRPMSLRWKNYVEALEYLPPEADYGWVYLRNTLWLVVMNVLGTLVSCSLVAYAFARLRFPGRDVLFKIMLSTMMLPAAVTLLPQFLIFRSFGWIDSLKPMWVTAWFGSAFMVFMLRQFFEQVPYELEDAAKIDGCSYLRSLWSVMLPQVKPALAVIAIMTFMGAWNNFMGPLVYSSSPETLPISYAVQLFNGDRNTEPGLLMAFVTMSLVPVVALFAFAQRFFIEGASLSGFGGR